MMDEDYNMKTREPGATCWTWTFTSVEDMFGSFVHLKWQQDHNLFGDKKDLEVYWLGRLAHLPFQLKAGEGVNPPRARLDGFVMLAQGSLCCPLAVHHGGVPH
jgi:hypothetical protein